MAIKRILLFAGILLVSFCAVAQEEQADSLRSMPMNLALLNLRNNWLQTENAAGMQLSRLWPTGKTALLYNNLSGGMKLAQQPESTDRLQFISERYQPLGKAIFYGSFSYTGQDDRNIRLSDVLDPYRGTPYILADSIGGNWKKQLYALKLKAAAPPLAGGRLMAGIGAELNVATGARQNDPRPLNRSNEINITPGLIWKSGSHSHVGINGLYGKYREEVSLEVKNTYINHFLYKLLGVGQYELPGIFSVGASRNYAGSKYGADLQYGLKTDRMNWLSTAGYRTYSEEVSDGNSVPRKAGTWKQKDYQVTSVLHFDGGQAFQQLKFEGQLLEDTGIEFHEYFNSAANQWQTILEAPFYLAETRRAALSYTFVQQSDEKVYNWLAAAALNYQSADKTYTVPASSARTERLDFSVKGGKNFLVGKNASLQTSLSLGYSKSLSDGLSFIPVTSDRNLIAREVLYPDHAYLTGDRLMVTCEGQYNFNMKKVKGTQFFMGTVIHVLQSLKDDLFYPTAAGNRSYFSLSIGAYY